MAFVLEMRPRVTAIIGVVVSLAACSEGTEGVDQATHALENANGESAVHEVIYEDAEAAEATDVAITARESGFSEERIRRRLDFERSFQSYALSLMNSFPDQISGIWMERLPNDRGHVRFAQDVPLEARSELKALAQFTPADVVLSGGGRIPRADHIKHAEWAASALGQRYGNFLTFYDFRKQVIRIEMNLVDGIEPPTRSEVRRLVRERVRAERGRDKSRQAGVRASMDAAVDALDVDLAIRMDGRSIVRLERGGSRLYDVPDFECTSGWSVDGPNGIGIVTADHCNGLNHIEWFWQGHRYLLPTTHRKGSLYRDVEYHTTVLAPAEFYSSAYYLRDVTSVQPTASMEGKSVCVYGHGSNERTCYMHVDSTNLNMCACPNETVCTCEPDCDPCGKERRDLARAYKQGWRTQPGDSGGGWSHTNTAFGVHQGSRPGSPNELYFTPVEETERWLDVEVLTK